MSVMKTHTAESLAAEFWSRRGSHLHVRLTVKQVAWMIRLLVKDDPELGRQGRQINYVLPGNGVPLALVVYPNGAGFIKAEDFATEVFEGKWRIKPQYEN